MTNKSTGSSRAKPNIIADADGDEALQAVEVTGRALEVDEATNQRLLRKIDLMILPVR